MPETKLIGRVTRVGNSLAVFIPAETVRKAGLAAGDRVQATLQSSIVDPFGLLSDLDTKPFVRHNEERKRDRI